MLGLLFKFAWLGLALLCFAYLLVLLDHPLLGLSQQIGCPTLGDRSFMPGFLMLGIDPEILVLERSARVSSTTPSWTLPNQSPSRSWSPSQGLCATDLAKYVISGRDEPLEADRIWTVWDLGCWVFFGFTRQGLEDRSGWIRWATA